MFTAVLRIGHVWCVSGYGSVFLIVLVLIWILPYKNETCTLCTVRFPCTIPTVCTVPYPCTVINKEMYYCKV
jgi:hypothetical protein